jgi:hypothetical protein
MLEFLEGFDHYTNGTSPPQAGKWDLGATPANHVAGRFGGLAARMINANLSLRTGQLTNQATRVIGFAVRWLTSYGTNTNPFVRFDDGTTVQVDLRLTAGRNIEVTRNGTVLGTSSNSILLDTWYYLQFKVTIDNSGSFEVRINDVNWVSASGVDTQNTANAYSNGVFFSNTGYDYYVDDLYILNSTGSVNNDFLGECRIHTVMPNGDGATTDFTPNAGITNYTQVDEIPPDGDTTYVSSSTPGDIDQYDFADITTTGSIAGVQVVIDARKDDAGARQIAESCRSGGVDYTGANTFTLSSDYFMGYRQIRELDPNTAAPWSVSGVNSAQFGVEVIT